MHPKQLIECRLCGSQANYAFSLLVLGDRNADYFECMGCESLMIKQPDWLPLAYDFERPNMDTGAVQRSLWNMAAVWMASKILGRRDILDFGGGTGLLARLLRDLGANAFSQDKYMKPEFIKGIQPAVDWKPEIVTAFEVLEHFDDPGSQLLDIFSHEPEFVILSTQIYANHGPDWWYLSPENGQHLFLYSAKAIRFIAARFGYESLSIGSYQLLSKRKLGCRKVFLKISLNKYFVHAFRSIILLAYPRGAEADLASLKRNARQ